MTKNSKPTHEVLHVAGDGEKARWTTIGVAWEHQDQDGLNFVLNYTPMIPGRLVIRRIKQKEAA